MRLVRYLFMSLYVWLVRKHCPCSAPRQREPPSCLIQPASCPAPASLRFSKQSWKERGEGGEGFPSSLNLKRTNRTKDEEATMRERHRDNTTMLTYPHTTFWTEGTKRYFTLLPNTANLNQRACHRKVFLQNSSMMQSERSSRAEPQSLYLGSHCLCFHAILSWWLSEG